MLYKKIAYSFMIALLLLSAEVKSSLDDQAKVLASIEQWNKLEYQQGLKGRTANVAKPMAKECGVLGGWSLVSGAAIHFLTLDPCCVWTMIATVFNIGLTVGYSGNTLKEGCCDKPAQAKTDQEKLLIDMLFSHSSSKEFQNAVKDNRSLFLAVEKVSKKMI